MKTPVMNNKNLNRLPPALMVGQRFQTWHWGDDGDGGYTKVPSRPGKGNVDGTTLRNAMTASLALKIVEMHPEYGIGMVMDNGRDGVPGVIFDLDGKNQDLSQCVMRELNGELMPADFHDFISAALNIGAYVEKSPSGLGWHVFVPGYLPEGHPQRWTLGQHERQEVFSTETRRWVTMTGDNKVMGTREGDLPSDEEDAGPIWEPDFARGQAFINEFYAQYLAPIEAEHQEAAERHFNAEPAATFEVSAEDAPRALEAAMAETAFSALWHGDNSKGRSEGDLHLLRMLAGVYGGNPAQMKAAFQQSGRMRAKHNDRRGAGDLLDFNIHKALYGNSKGEFRWSGQPYPFKPASRTSLTAISWTPTQRDDLLFTALNKLTGTIAVRKACRALLAELFNIIDAARCHIEDGQIIVHAHGLKNLSEAVGGIPTHIGTRLCGLAELGFLAHYSTDAKGRPRIGLSVRGEDCAALQKAAAGELEGELPVHRPAAPRKPRAMKPRDPEAPTKPRAPRIPKPLGAAQWTAYMVARGYRDPQQIAERTLESVQAVKRHLSTLERADLLGATYAEYLAARGAELQEAQRLTRERREAERLAWPAKHAQWLALGRDLLREAQAQPWDDEPLLPCAAD